MKKFTLFLMSMFLMLGTAVAQDDAFQLTFSNPSSDKPVSQVYYIQLVFSKNVTVTLPAEPITITNDKNSDVFEIVYGMGSDQNAILYFQKVEELAEDQSPTTSITEPGTYTYTIPAGVIKSIDGDIFGEYTASFTVAKPLEIAGVTPAETAELKTIQITFDEPIASVNMPNSGLSVTDLYWSEFFNIKDEVSFSEDRKTVTLELEKSITTIGKYFLTIYSGVFIGESGAQNDQIEIPFNVIDPTPAYITNYENGDKVKEIGNLEITFKNVTEVKLVDGADPITLYLPGESYVTGATTQDGNKITVTFDQEFTELGIYTFYIPAGVFTMDGAANEMREITVELVDSNITPLEIVNISPEEDTVNELGKIVITFNQVVQLSNDENWQQISREIKMTCGDKEYILTYNSMASANNSLEYLVNAEWDLSTNQYKFTPITEEGEYTLDLSQVVVDHAAEEGIDEYGWPALIWNSKNQRCSGTVTWTIVAGESSIEDIVVEEGAKVIYDLTGRRVETITAPGIYIVNSKKVLVK